MGVSDFPRVCGGYIITVDLSSCYSSKGRGGLGLGLEEYYVMSVASQNIAYKKWVCITFFHNLTCD